MHRLNLWIACLMLSVALAATARAGVPIVTDSRIKTFVYNENEVYNVTTHYGYQANIEFTDNETIETVSVGDRVGWQIVPSGQRLFIRAMEENAHTNMTIVTSKRAYQFDLRSSASDAVYGSEELTYVVRFYYPSETRMPTGPVIDATSIGAASAAPIAPVAVQPIASAPVASAPIASAPLPPAVNAAPLAPVSGAQTATVPPAAPIQAAPLSPLQPLALPQTRAAAPAPAVAALNYRYTYTGPSNSAPVKIYDDGRATYFKFRDMRSLPRFAAIAPNGQETPVTPSVNSEGLAVVPMVAPRFSLRTPTGDVMVFNEARG
jgi:type IV secretion system protein VirB9